MSCSPLFRRAARLKEEEDKAYKAEPLAGAVLSRLLDVCGEVSEDADWRGAAVLHLECGTGETTGQISARWPALRMVLGLDKDPAAADLAWRLQADETLDFCHVDPEDGSTFDRAWAGRFQWALGPGPVTPAALRNLLWCLKPATGRCALAVLASKPPDVHAAALKLSSWKKFLKEVPRSVSELQDPNCGRLWCNHAKADRVYAAMLEQVGLEVLMTRVVELQYNFVSLGHYRDVLAQVFRTVIDAVPEDRRAKLLESLVRAGLRKSGAKRLPSWNLQYAFVIARRSTL
ncbi:hypothetical protein LAZ67_8000430 [Cordylochernes scorpioides]|uniref:Methyltransferase domain-containing protein n=1 Tax=Cordylochernes scorpioides TaxID=51811 RepID=A0ABY6KPF4_9ARAC|nr:hypothetical protein LAZ67_8000430 [Cordylochernes scorpioides]